MKELFEENLATILAMESKDDVTNQNKNLRPSHIFNSILTFILANSDKPNKLDYITLFCNYEKLLNYSRKKDYNICEFYVNRINEYHNQIRFPTKLEENGLNSLYHPAIAYYHYSCSRYNVAVTYMDKSLKNIDYLIISGFKDAIFMKIEQYLNKFRLCYDMKNFEEAIALATDVLAFIIQKDSNQKFCHYPLRDVILSDNQYFQLFSLFVNTIIFKVIRNFKTKDEIFDNIFLISLVTAIIKNTEATNSNANVASSIKILKLIFVEKNLNEKTLLNNEFYANILIPNSIKYILLEYVVKINPDYKVSMNLEKAIDKLLSTNKYRFKYLN